MEAILTQDSLPEMLLVFYQEMEQSPDDFSIRKIAADWCADNGLYDWERYLRWSVAKKKRPHYCDQTNSWDWWLWERRSVDRKSDLPMRLFELLQCKSDWVDANSWHESESMLFADSDLKQALEKRGYK